MVFKSRHFAHQEFILLMRLMLITPESVFKVISDDTSLTSSLLKEARTRATRSRSEGTAASTRFYIITLIKSLIS